MTRPLTTAAVFIFDDFLRAADDELDQEEED